MRLYRISGQSARERRQWVGTQDDARKGARERGGFFDHVEVPTDKPGMLDYLNQAEAERVGVASSAPAPEPAPEPARDHPLETPPLRVGGDRRADLIAKSADIDGLVDWLADAEPWQVERIFEALGGRVRSIIRNGA